MIETTIHGVTSIVIKAAVTGHSSAGDYAFRQIIIETRDGERLELRLFNSGTVAAPLTLPVPAERPLADVLEEL